ncbi:MAG: hypothetical protein QOE97_417 [Pseudonocardiales bacterium]|jgi:hypothetical protein|nr:hypothetical protein [Pseudonocardiales bacterium]
MNKPTRWALAVVAAAGLVVDAWTHFDLAHLYDFNRTSTVNEGVLFRVEASLAIVAAVWILVRPGYLSAAFTVLLAGGGAALLVVYRYVDVGKLGPLPNMHEPIWYREKTVSLIGELVATAAALVLLAALPVLNRRRAARTAVSA